MMALFPFLAGDNRHHGNEGASPQDLESTVDTRASISCKGPLNHDPPSQAPASLNVGSQPRATIVARKSSSFSESSSHASTPRRVLFPRYGEAPHPEQTRMANPSSVAQPAPVHKSVLQEGQSSSSLDSFSSPADQACEKASTVGRLSPTGGVVSQDQRLVLDTASLGRVPLTSILRPPSKSFPLMVSETTSHKSPGNKTEAVDKIPSVESDIPSLASTTSQQSVEEANVAAVAVVAKIKPSKARRSVSAPVSQADHKKISFDPRVWVREFTRSPSEDIWYTPAELEKFKCEAIQLILEQSETELVPTGTGRFVPRKVIPQGKALFSHKALRMETTEDIIQSDIIAQKIASKEALKKKEVRKILVVDPHDICVKLFAKAFKLIFPTAEVIGASNVDEALVRTKSSSIDVVLVEERLKLFHQHNCAISSGSALIRTLKQQFPQAVFIGVSTRLKDDSPNLKQGGADLCWSKPPPRMDECIADEILRLLLDRRGRIRDFIA